MQKDILMSDPSKISEPAAYLAIGAGTALVLLLASLHFLSPEFDPAWRVISEYANGQYGWILSLMFVAGALSVWALAFALRSQVRTRAGKIGLGILIIAGFGPAMAAVFDINQPLHNVASPIGVLCLPVAAMLISVSLSRTQPWSTVKKGYLWAANLTWVITIVFAISMVLLIVTYIQTGGDMTASSVEVTTVPPGVIAVNGWTNRLLLVVNNCVWPAIIAWQAIQLRRSLLQ